MESSNQKFLKWFQEFYSHEFTSLSKEFKDSEIKEILFNNQKYITKEDVIAFDACAKCGRCCESHKCLDYDYATKLCKRHDNPIHELCQTYPWTGEDFGISPLTLNCQYMVSFFVDFFDKYFQEEVEKNASGNH